MSIRTPRPTYNDRIQRKRTAPRNLIDERVYKYLKHVNNADCISIGPSDRQINIPCQEHHNRSGRSKSAPSVHRRRNQEKASDHTSLHTASEQGDTSLIDGGDKLAQARGGCTKSQKHSKDPDTPDVVVRPLTERALYQLNKLNRTSSSEASPAMTSGISSALPESLIVEKKEGLINAYSPSYCEALEERGIEFADDQRPSNFKKLKEALKEKRSTSVPDDAAVKRLRNLVSEANSESGVVQNILPEIVPHKALDHDTNCMVPDDKWDLKTMVEPNVKPALTPVKPNWTYGWPKKHFECKRAMKLLGAYACPVVKSPQLAFPLFTIEVKGEKGCLKVARLQNLHNGATMLSNLWNIRQFYDKEKENEFFDNVHAMSLQLTAESIQLSCYWAARNGNGGIKFYGTEVRTWSLYEVDQYKKACRYTLNAMDWVREQASGWITLTLERLEGSFNTTVPTPPRTQYDQGNAKRTRSSTSESHSANPPSKKLGSEKTRESLSAGDEEAGLEIGTSEDVPAAMALEGENVVGS